MAMMKARKPKAKVRRYAEGGSTSSDYKTVYNLPSAGYRPGMDPEHNYLTKVKNAVAASSASGSADAANQYASDLQAAYNAYNQGGGAGGSGGGGGGADGEAGGPGGPSGPGSANSGDTGDTSMNGEPVSGPPPSGESDSDGSGSGDGDGDAKGGLIKLKKKNMAKGGFLKSVPMKKMAKGGVVKTATNFGRGDGKALRGKTKGRMV